MNLERKMKLADHLNKLCLCAGGDFVVGVDETILFVGRHRGAIPQQINLSAAKTLLKMALAWKKSKRAEWRAYHYYLEFAQSLIDDFIVRQAEEFIDSQDE